MRTSPGVLALLAISTFFAGKSYSDPIMDQSFADVGCLSGNCTSGLNFALDEGLPFAGQTVTAGISGNLTSVSIVGNQRSGLIIPWIIDIVSAPGGVPDGTLLAQSDPFALPTDGNGWTSIPIPAQPFMAAGTGFAIVIQLQGINTPSPGWMAGNWGGAIYPGDPYAGGTPVGGNALNALLFEGSYPPHGQGDLFFETFVSPIPEPGAFLLAVTAFGMLILLTRGRRAVTP